MQLKQTFQQYIVFVLVKIGYQSCVYATAMHTELELSTPSAVVLMIRQLQLEAVLTRE